MTQRNVYIIRHAKTETGYGKHDFERDLIEKGMVAARNIGRRLHEREIVPDLIIASTANRAAATAAIIAEQLTYNKKDIDWREALYLCEASVIDNVISSIPDKYHTLFIIAHNIGITDYANHKIDGFAIDNVPTAGVVGFSLNIDKWTDNNFQLKGVFQYYDAPKLIK